MTNVFYFYFSNNIKKDETKLLDLICWKATGLVMKTQINQEIQKSMDDV